MKKVLVVLVIFFTGCFIIEQCNKSKRESVDAESNEVINLDSQSNYESSGNESSEIISCPKCGKSYNKSTWGEMCNTCWNEGRGLKSNGREILK